MVNLERACVRKRAPMGYDGLISAPDAQGASVEVGDFLSL